MAKHQPPTHEEMSEGLQAATTRRDKALEEYQAALDEIEWWKSGLRLLGREPDDDPPATATELFMPLWMLKEVPNPSLRQAMVAVMGERPGFRWRVSDLVAALDEEDWLPARSQAKVAAKRVSDMASVMVGDGQIQRMDRGIYILAPEVAAAVETKLLGRDNPDPDVDAS